VQRVPVNYEPVHDASPLPATRCILILEDDGDNARVMARLISSRGFSVVTAGSLAEARACINQGNVGFLIADLSLPDGNACDLMRELSTKGIKGTAISGFGMDEDMERSRAAGFAFHLTKPIVIADLEHVMAMAKLMLDSADIPKH
jgi:CheY-like chemotaxis protein